MRQVEQAKGLAKGLAMIDALDEAPEEGVGMYLPPAFEESRPELLQELMQRHSFALLVTHAAGELTASHVPLMTDLTRGERGVLSGHLARANEQWRHFEAGSEALAIFQGPHAYVSPSWYEAEQAVPTWNYSAIHAYGTPALIEDPTLVRSHLEALVNTYEAGRERPWELDRLPEEFVRSLMRGIVFFEIPIRRLEGKLKLSQNRSEADRRGVIQALAGSDAAMDRELADLMRQLCPRSG